MVVTVCITTASRISGSAMMMGIVQTFGSAEAQTAAAWKALVKNHLQSQQILQLIQQILIPLILILLILIPLILIPLILIPLILIPLNLQLSLPPPAQTQNAIVVKQILQAWILKELLEAQRQCRMNFHGWSVFKL